MVFQIILMASLESANLVNYHSNYESQPSIQETQEPWFIEFLDENHWDNALSLLVRATKSKVRKHEPSGVGGPSPKQSASLLLPSKESWAAAVAILYIVYCTDRKEASSNIHATRSSRGCLLGEMNSILRSRKLFVSVRSSRFFKCSSFSTRKFLVPDRGYLEIRYIFNVYGEIRHLEDIKMGGSIE